MKKYSLLLLLLFIAVYCSAQNTPYSMTFGGVTASEMAVSESLKGYGSDAVVIFAMGSYSFPDDQGFLELTEPFPIFRKDLYTKIKINNDAGVRYAIFEIPYDWFSYDLGVFNITGYTYNVNVDGSLSMTQLSGADITDTKQSDGSFIKRISFPDVKAGSVIELKYNHWSKHTRMPAWYFQQDIPVLLSELSYTNHPYFGYAGSLKGATKYDYTKRDVIAGEQLSGYATAPDRLILKYGMKNLSAFRNEEFTNNAADQMVRMEFRLASSITPKNMARKSYDYTWDKVFTNLSGDRNFGRYMKSSLKVIKVVTTEKSSKQISADVYNHIRDSYSWDGRRSVYASQKPSDLIKKGSGNSADINLLLVGALAGCGVEAYPVVLSSRDNGAIDKSTPSDSWFDYVVVMVKDGDDVYFLDATNKFMPFGELPARAANVECVAIIPDGAQWVNTVQDDFAFEGVQCDVRIDPASSNAEVMATRSYEGNNAVEMRVMYNSDPSAAKTAVTGNYVGVTLDNIAFVGTDKVGEPLNAKYDYTVHGGVSADSGNITVIPSKLIIPAANMFTQSGGRRFPVSMPFRVMRSYKMVLDIPEGYHVASLPQTEADTDTIGSFSYKAHEENGKVVVEAMFNLAKTDYPVAQYNLLKNLNDLMLKSLDKAVVLTPEK